MNILNQCVRRIGPGTACAPSAWSLCLLRFAMAICACAACTVTYAATCGEPDLKGANEFQKILNSRPQLPTYTILVGKKDVFWYPGLRIATLQTEKPLDVACAFFSGEQEKTSQLSSGGERIFLVARSSGLSGSSETLSRQGLEVHISVQSSAADPQSLVLPLYSDVSRGTAVEIPNTAVGFTHGVGRTKNVVLGKNVRASYKFVVTLVVAEQQSQSYDSGTGRFKLDLPSLGPGGLGLELGLVEATSQTDALMNFPTKGYKIGSSAAASKHLEFGTCPPPIIKLPRGASVDFGPVGMDLLLQTDGAAYQRAFEVKVENPKGMSAACVDEIGTQKKIELRFLSLNQIGDLVPGQFSATPSDNLRGNASVAIRILDGGKPVASSRSIMPGGKFIDMSAGSKTFTAMPIRRSDATDEPGSFLIPVIVEAFYN